MQEDLNNILSRALGELYSEAPSTVVTDGEIAEFLRNTICVLPCGGESKRMAGLSDKHKTALELPDGETLVARTIHGYASTGIKQFVLLTGINAESVIESTKHLEKEGLEIKYSPDPGKPVGRGGAILNAILKGFIPRESNSIVHNADDQVLGYPGDFVVDICRAHINHKKNGGWITAVVAKSTPYPYTGMQISRGKVVNITTTPAIPVPTHIGVTIMSPIVYSKFDELFNLTEKKDFEGYLFPILALQDKLFGFGVPGNCWYPVNNPKEYDNLVKVLQSNPAYRNSFNK